MTGYSLRPVSTLASREIWFAGRYVGYLIPPRWEGDTWDIFPDAFDTSGLPDGDQGFRHRPFASEADALAFLGLGETRAAA